MEVLYYAATDWTNMKLYLPSKCFFYDFIVGFSCIVSQRAALFGFEL